MSKILVDTIDTRSGTSNITIGSSNASQITLKSGATLTNFPANTPAFFAYLSGDQNISNNSFTKANFNTEDLDTDNCYDNSTNYRFTPTVAGKYFVYSALLIQAGGYVAYGTQINLRKNGSDYIVNRATTNSSTLYELVVNVSAVIDFNGSSDYAEVYGFSERHSGSAQQKFVAANRRCYFGAYKVIGA